VHKILVTAIREYKSTVLTPAFIFATFILPVIFYGVMIAAISSGALEGDKQAAEGTIGIVNQTPNSDVVESIERFFTPEQQATYRVRQVEEAVDRQVSALPFEERKEAFEQGIRAKVERETPPPANITIEALPADADIDVQRDRVRTGELLALVVLPETVMDDSRTRFELVGAQKLRDEIADQITTGVQEGIVNERYAQASIDRDVVRELAKRPRAKRVTVTESGETDVGDRAELISPIAAIMLQFLAIFTGAGYLLTSMVEEKSSRVVEVLLSAVSPMQLMTGKVVGGAMVGITVLAIYGGFGVAAAIRFGLMELISPATLAMLIVYFFIGYFTYASLFAAVGSVVNEAREAQALQGPLFGIAFLFIYLGMFAAMNDSNSLVTRLLSFFPLGTPFIMSMRVGNPADPPPMWEIPATMAVGFATVVFLIWASAKIFRVGVLMYGKPPSLIGLVKMVRQA